MKGIFLWPRPLPLPPGAGTLVFGFLAFNFGIMARSLLWFLHGSNAQVVLNQLFFVQTLLPAKGVPGFKVYAGRKR